MPSKIAETPAEILEHLPLNPKVLMVLLSLLEGPTHGYEIKRQAEAQSGGALRLDAGSLYRTLAQLEERGLVKEAEARPEPEADDPRRRYYELTALGTGVLRAETTRLRGILDMAEARDLIPEPEGAA